MPKINQLSFDVANLIAAGEVVDRPASVVKELLENAIDAGATAITAEIRRGGATLIRIADNGCGMTPEDLPVAIRRHATSKIRDAEDLDTIATLGFRGEALAAIAAVSELTIISKTKEATVGTLLTASAGQVTELGEVGCADGTTVTVERLFDNVPARRKFLKKDSTETQAVSAVAERVALSRPDVAITFLADGVRKFATPGNGDLANTLYALYGRDFASRLLKAEGAVGSVSVSGLIGRPDNARGSRTSQNVFVNGRYVHSKTVTAAAERAYTSYMAPEKFPVYALFLTIPLGAVDVNVHPAKLEVKFSDERSVFEAVYYAVRSALETCEKRPELQWGKSPAEQKADKLIRTLPPAEKGEQMRLLSTPTPRPTVPHYAPRPQQPEKKQPLPSSTLSPTDSCRVLQQVSRVTSSVPYSDQPQSWSVKKQTPDEDRPASALREAESEPEGDTEQREEDRSAPKLDTVFPTPSAQTAPVPETVPTPQEDTLPAEQPEKQLPVYKIVGQLFSCYILVELEDGRALMIDQHAAHERILFEQLKKKAAMQTAIASQELLIPLTVPLSAEEQGVAKDAKEHFASLGFSYNISEGKALFTSIPRDISPAETESLFLALCGDLLQGGEIDHSEAARRERMLYTVACKAAIKGGRRYDEAHIRWLVETLLSLPDITVCPHGRPVAFYLTKSELDRRFARLK